MPVAVLHLQPDIHKPGGLQRENSGSVEADAEGTASAKLELSTMLDSYGGLSAGAGGIKASAGGI
jgi:hypothetical protein